MPQILLPIATDAVGQTLSKKMIEGKGLKNSEALIPLHCRPGLLRKLPMAPLPWVDRSIKGTNNIVNRLTLEYIYTLYPNKK